jgi:hypothetical protein
VGCALEQLDEFSASQVDEVAVVTAFEIDA